MQLSYMRHSQLQNICFFQFRWSCILQEKKNPKKFIKTDYYIKYYSRNTELYINYHLFTMTRHSFI